MKRIIIIAVLLGICVSLSIYCIHHTNQVNEFLSATVARALNAIEEGDMETLEWEVDNLSNYWNNEEDYLVHFIRHAHIDEITKNVARLQALFAGRDLTELAAELMSIRWQMEHVHHNERLILRNLF